MTKLLWVRSLSEKPLILFPCLSWPISLYKIVKQSLQQIQSCEAAWDILDPKWTNCPKQEFFRISHWYKFYALLAPSIVQNFKKTLRANPKLWGWAILSPNGRFAPNKHFLGKIINIIFIYRLTHFIVPNI